LMLSLQILCQKIIETHLRAYINAYFAFEIRQSNL